MEPACFPITITQGATFDLEVAWQDSNEIGINMSGWTLKADLYNRLGTQKLASFVLPWSNQASGIFRLTMAASTTSGITENGQYDVFATDPSGRVYCPLEGSAHLNPSLSFRP
jgi:hypothetical protein